MAKCKECGYELQVNEKVCPHCGCPTENAGATSCKECGYALQGNEKVCPNCGCPTEFGGVAAYMDSEVLNEGKSTEAETVVIKLANAVLIWGKFLAWFTLIWCCLGAIGGIVMAIDHPYDEGGYFLAILCIICGIFGYIIIRLIAKVIWGVIMLFVNMSTTLKRVEILNEQILNEVKK